LRIESRDDASFILPFPMLWWEPWLFGPIEKASRTLPAGRTFQGKALKLAPQA